MKVLSNQQVRDADAYTIKNEPVESINLMERASRQLYFWFRNYVDPDREINILCGKGNNGGDGLALSQMLLYTGWKVKTVIVDHSPNGSPDFETNLKRLRGMQSDISYWKKDEASPSFSDDALVVDAILGSGLNSPLRGFLKDVASVLNGLQNEVVAIDIPTGMFADDNAENDCPWWCRPIIP